jgi:hypothetical protein
MKLVTVYTSFSPAEAQLIRARLEASRFHAVVKDELSALSVEGYSLATGGIKVQVPEEEEADAKALLASADSNPTASE